MSSFFKDLEDSDILLIETTSYCNHDMAKYWIMAICIQKGFIVIFGLVVAWKTRSIHDPNLCDAKYSGWCIFNIGILCLVALPLEQFLPGNLETTKVVIESSVIIAACLTCQCVIFIPKASTF